MKSKSHIFLTWLLCSVLAGNAQQAVEFTENKGQWNNSVLFKGEITNGALFLQKSGFTVLLYNDEDMQRLTEKVHGHSDEKQAVQPTGNKGAYPRPSRGDKTDDNDSAVLRSHAYTMRFAGANLNAAVTGEKPVSSYNNYFIGDDPSQWAGNCSIFQSIVYKNIYPNIDVRYYSDAGQIKYDLILYPGANINDIVMQYDGVDKLQIRNRELYIKTSVGDVKELSPYSYQTGEQGRKEVDCRYVLEGKDKVRLKVKQYDPSQTLVIDPMLIFSTFTGSLADQWGFTATYGADGSLYSGGIVFGAGFPVSTGAFQTNYRGTGQNNFNIGIMKFNSSGRNRLYATYLGGRGADQPHSLIEDSRGNLVILGRTSSDNYPLQPQDNTSGATGSYDIIVTKLNASGTQLIGSKKIGGSGYDGVNISPERKPSSLSVFYGDDSRSEVILDKDDNIYVASCTQSGNFPTTTGASQTSKAGGQDGVLMKIAPDVSTVLFSTLFGGNGDDGTFVLALHPITNDIYVAGSTKSQDLPEVPSSGVIAPTYQGGSSDGFIAIFDNTGKLQKATYLGTNSMDAIYGLKFDESGFPYVMGVTLGVWPVTPGVYNNPGTKQFIVKMQPDLSASVYSTTFGSGSSSYNISPVAFAVDKCENVYVSGWGGRLSPEGDDAFRTAGTLGMPTKDCNILPNGCSSDNSDFYFFVLGKNAQDILFGAFYGQFGGFGDHVDGGTSRFDSKGVIYQAICAACNIEHFPPVTPLPVTPGVWRPRTGNPRSCNLAAVKLEMDFSGVSTGLRTSIEGKPYRDYGCTPVTVDFSDTLRKGKKYVWDFGDGNTVTTITPDISHTYNVVGSYNVRLISIDSSKCVMSDTAYTTIRVRTDRALIGATAAKLLPCSSLNFEFTNTSVAPPAKPFQGAAFTWDFGDGSAPVTKGTEKVQHEFPAPGTYHVKLSLADTNYCNTPDTFTLIMRVAPNVKAQFTTPPEGCLPYLAEFNNISEAGQSFYWDFGDGATSNEFAPVHEYTSVGTYTVKLKVVDSMTCNISDSTTFTLTVRPRPTAGFTFSPVTPQENTPTTYTNTSLNAISYKWFFGDGDTSILTNPVHQFNATNDFNTCLIAYNEYGCADTSCQIVSALVSPLVAVPNAFSPNGDGVNDKVYVRGYAIGKMLFRIYNRWGQLVYESTDRHEGWDGKYKGTLQPMDSYAYTLEIEFTDGSKATKKGDITLLR